MAKNNGKEGSPVDVYILSIGKEDSWKGTPLDVEEEQLKSEPTTTTASSTVSSDAGSTPEKKSKKEDKESASKVKDTLVNEKHKAINLNKSPFPKVSPPTRKELEAFTENKKASSPPSLLASPLVAPNSGEALSLKQSHSIEGSSIIENGGIGRGEVTAAALASQPPPSSPPPAGQISAEKESVGGGNGARKELEDAIQRIEAHIKTEQAARRAAEGALAQARQQSQDISPSTQLASAPLVPTPSYAELQVALEDLANAQLAVQRAHAVVAYIVSQQQQKTADSGNLHLPVSIKEKKDTTTNLPSPVIRHTAPMLSSSSSPVLPYYDGGSSGAADLYSPSSPTLAKVLTKERGMSWVAGGAKEPSTKQNWTTPNLKVKTGLLREPLEGSNAGGKTPTGAVRKKDSTILPSSPKTGTPMSSKKGDSSSLSPTRGGSGKGSGRFDSPKATEWNNDRFATGKAEAFMLSQSARWNSK